MFIDLSHRFEDGMPGFTMRTRDGRVAPFTASVKPFLTHEQSRPFYDGKASFELTEITFQTSIGTYLDSPMHRFEGMRDISELSLDEVILDGVVVSVDNPKGGKPVHLEACDIPDDIQGKAVLFRFGWDQYWGTDAYDTYPFIGRDVIDHLVAAGVKLFGVDAFNADDRNNPERPCHSELLKRDILIVENLTNLGALPRSGFRFFAVPIKAKATAAMTVRAFAET
ncbi:MAG: cyclase family protein [Geminicoccaceae bacterium]